MTIRWSMLTVLVAAAGWAPAIDAEADWGGIVEALAAPAPIDRPLLTNRLLAKAKPDECFDGIGNPYPPMGPDRVCTAGEPKTNAAYVWGLVQAGDKLWLGTAPNVLCLGVGGFLGGTEAFQTGSYVCELGEGYNATAIYPDLPAASGDWRPPRAYSYDLAAGKLIDRTPGTDSAAGKLFASTLGIRSAGALDGVAILAGPTLAGGVAFFAYDSDSGKRIGSCRASAFANIRQWLVANGSLYAGVAYAGGGGGLVRWTGTRDKPFKYADPTGGCGLQTVSKLAGDAAYIALYGGNRIAISAWPTGLGGAGVYLSHAFGADGRLSPADADVPLTPIWTPSDYDPDPVVASTYGGGPIVEWQGALYWGTMHVPAVAMAAHLGCDQPYCYGPATLTTAEQIQLLAATQRAAAIFRGRNLGTPSSRIALLYGESELPAFEPGTGEFASKPTGMTPRFGPSGFGNPYNNYAWTMATIGGRLFVGTMDWRYLADESLAGLLVAALPLGLALPPIALPVGHANLRGYGADLWRFDSPTQAAIPEDVRGLGNPANYGIRTLIPAADGKSLYAGTANPMNLSTKGGWELRRLALPEDPQ
jgi:hypothetical protein